MKIKEHLVKFQELAFAGWLAGAILLSALTGALCALALLAVQDLSFGDLHTFPQMSLVLGIVACGFAGATFFVFRSAPRNILTWIGMAVFGGATFFLVVYVVRPSLEQIKIIRNPIEVHIPASS